MSSISMMEARLPPGFRFHPRDDELVLDYLCRRLSRGGGVAMVDVDLNKCEPWDLPGEACVGGREWYFFSLRDRKYATGQRTNRATLSGYWKATGKDRPVRGRSGAAVVVGMRKTLVFYRGRAPRGTKTEWVMHEFRRVEALVGGVDAVAGRPTSPLAPNKEDWVLCRVFYKSRSTVARPADADEAGSLSSSLADLPMPPLPHYVPPAAAYMAFELDPAPAVAVDGGGLYQQDQEPGLTAAPAEFESVSSFRNLLSSMVGVGGNYGGAKAEVHDQRDGWGEAAYAQPAHVAASPPLVWNPFLSSG